MEKQVCENFRCLKELRFPYFLEKSGKTATLYNYVILSSGLLLVTYFGHVVILECSRMFACFGVGEERQKWGRLEVSSVIGSFSVVIQTGEVHSVSLIC